MVCPKTPIEAGMPEQFGAWRTNQPSFINLGLSEKKRITAICAGTGFGKQICATAIALLSNRPTCIVVPYRGLQDQYMELKIPGMADLRGRKNYICAMRDDEDYTCEQGYASRCPYRGTVACPSSAAEIKAASSRIVVTNYDKWTSSKKFGLGMNHFTQVIFDEGDEGPEALSRAMQVTLHHREIEETLNIPFPTGADADDMHEWKSWAGAARVVAEEEMVDARHKLVTTTDPKPTWVKHYLHMKNLVKRLGTISTSAAKEWVAEEIEGGYQFDPIKPGRYVEAVLLLRVPRIIFISATIRPKTMFMCGIGKDQFDFHEFASDFDPKRHPVYWIPTMRVEYGRDLSLLWARLDQILAKRRDRKGLVQTVSFKRQEEIYNTSRFVDNMIINPRGEPPTDMVERFKSSPPGTYLVSPSIGMGYDFPDDCSRFNFLCKVPFEPPSKIQKARQELDNEYVYYRAMRAIVQGFGRDVRSKQDWSEGFIGDDHISWFMGRYGHLAPKSFHAIFKRVETLPPPLNIEGGN